MTDVAETARSATSELVDACRALPDFDTLQIVSNMYKHMVRAS